MLGSSNLIKKIYISERMIKTSQFAQRAQEIILEDLKKLITKVLDRSHDYVSHSLYQDDLLTHTSHLVQNLL